VVSNRVDQLKKLIQNYAHIPLICLFFYLAWKFISYPASEDPVYMVEWVIVVTTAFAAWVVASMVSSGYNVAAIGVIAFWVYGLGVGVRNHTIAQLPCTNWEKTTCWACTETDYTQSGEQCIAGEDYECEVCTERTWRSYERK
jgi:hypothetical protein